MHTHTFVFILNYAHIKWGRVEIWSIEKKKNKDIGKRSESSEENWRKVERMGWDVDRIWDEKEKQEIDSKSNGWGRE